MRKKRSKKVSEAAQMQVTMTPTGAATSQTGQVTVDVDAMNPEDALRKASASMPGKKFDQVAVAAKQGTPGQSAPAQPAQPAQPSQPASPVTPNPMSRPAQPSSMNIESFRYPYGIVVPKIFEAVLKK
jgi:hypothetical protein